MALKKCNAALALLSIVLLLLHIGYIVYAYLTFDFNADISKTLAHAARIAICLHAILGMCIVFLMGDGTRLIDYPRRNLTTVLQRVSAALMFPLLLPHVQNFTILGETAERGQMAGFTAVIVLEVLFFADVAVHVAVSFSRALITLGWLQKPRTQKTLDRIAWVVSAAVFLLASVVVVRTQLLVFLH